jgi:erythromycin esterase-like protein
MTAISHDHLIDDIARHAIPLSGDAHDYDALLGWIGDARMVLLGEASHGSHEFYTERAAITRRLILEKGFTAVAVEADWPDAYRVNRFVHGRSADRRPAAALGDFRRFPRWMWRNTVVHEFVGWLRHHNERHAAGRAGAARAVGFYGVDLYSLHASIDAVMRYLATVDPEGADRARARYSCFDHYGGDPQSYGQAAGFGLSRPCEDEVVRQLIDLRRHAEDYLHRDGLVAEDEFFHAEQNARLVANAETYYRTMFQGRVSSWNLRDRHMAETLAALDAHLARHGATPKIVVWEHNSHVGDARATEMRDHGEWTVGQLVRERYGSASRSVGFTTYHGTVTAAHDWDGPPERMEVRPALPGSYEAAFHHTGLPRFLLGWREAPVLAAALDAPRLERAIGVIYRPDTERVSHYFHARLASQFDAIIHIDRTNALEPLDHEGGEPAEDAPETYPSGA